MPRVKHYPTARLPRSDRRYGSGVVLAAVAHVLAIGLLLVTWTHRYELSMGEGVGPAGGGGGGGGGRSIQYVQLPPRSAYGAQRARQVPAAPKQEIQLPTPQVQQAEEPVQPTSPQPVELALPTVDPNSSSTRLALGAGSGTGLGPGSGSGSGGGIGSGRGTGVGSGVGPGSGGEGVVKYAPEPRAVIYPFEEPPPAMRGQQYRIRFWVDARGKITKIEIEPEIQDKKFREKLLERVRSWSFYPARTAEGRPVNGQFEITYAP